MQTGTKLTVLAATALLCVGSLALYWLGGRDGPAEAGISGSTPERDVAGTPDVAVGNTAASVDGSGAPSVADASERVARDARACLRVVDGATGVPLAGVAVRVQRPDARRELFLPAVPPVPIAALPSPALLWEGTTDTRGRVDVEERSWLWDVGLEWELALEGYAPRVVARPARAEGDREAEVALAPLALLRGELVPPDAARTEFHVRAGPAGDQGGEPALARLGGARTFELRVPSGPVWVVGVSSRHGLSGPVQVEVDPVDGATVRLELGAGRSVRGRVETTEGLPVAGAEVWNTSPPGGEAWTDASGEFELAVVGADSMVLRASADGFAPAFAVVTLPLEPDAGDDELVLRLATAVRLRGRLRELPTGRPAAGVVVARQALGSTSHGGPLRTAGTSELRAAADASGEFVVDGLRPGTEVLLVGRTEGDHVGWKRVDVPAGATVVDAGVLAARGTLDVLARLVDSERAPASGAHATLVVERWGDPEHADALRSEVHLARLDDLARFESTTDADGTVRFERVPAGEGVWWVDHAGARFDLGRVRLADDPSGTLDLGEVVLASPPDTGTARLGVPDGVLPFAGEVVWTCPDGSTGRGSVDAEGTVHWQGPLGCADAEFVLRLEHEGDRSHVPVRAQGGGDGLELLLDGGGFVTFVLDDAARAACLGGRAVVHRAAAGEPGPQLGVLAPAGDGRARLYLAAPTDLIVRPHGPPRDLAWRGRVGPGEVVALTWTP